MLRVFGVDGQQSSADANGIFVDLKGSHDVIEEVKGVTDSIRAQRRQYYKFHVS